MVMEEQLIRAYWDERIGWLLFMPDGSQLPAQCQAKVTVSDNWNNKERPDAVVVIEMPCKVVNVNPAVK
jgi:hypothetical protein